MGFLTSAYNILVDLSDITTVVCVLIFLPLAIFRSKRRIAGKGLKYASAIFLINLWIYALGALWHYWGLIAVIVGVVFTPVVASVIAAIAVTIHRDWSALFGIVTYIVLTISAYLGGDKLAGSGPASS